MDKLFKRSVGNRIRIIRGKLDMNQTELGKALKLSKTAVSGYELGDASPALDTISALADLAGVSCDWIIRGREDDGGEPPAETELTPEESRLLAAYRTIGRMEQAAVLRIIESLSRANTSIPDPATGST